MSVTISAITLLAPFMTSRQYAFHTELYRHLMEGFPGDEKYLNEGARAELLAEVAAKGLSFEGVRIDSDVVLIDLDRSNTRPTALNSTDNATLTSWRQELYSREEAAELPS